MSALKKDDRSKTNFKVEPEILRSLRKELLRQEKTMQSVVSQLIEEWVHASAGGQERCMPVIIAIPIPSGMPATILKDLRRFVNQYGQTRLRAATEDDRSFTSPEVVREILQDLRDVLAGGESSATASGTSKTSKRDADADTEQAIDVAEAHLEDIDADRAAGRGKAGGLPGAGGVGKKK